MSSSGKERGHPSTTPRDDCHIHVDKEGESCVIKIESVGQEKMLKEILDRMTVLKTDLNQLLNGSATKQNSSKEILDSLHELNGKIKLIDDHLQKFGKNLHDEQRSQTDLNKKLDEIKHDFNEMKQQQKNNGPTEKIQQKLDQIGRRSVRETID